MIPARILGSAHWFPERVVPTAELVEQTRPGADPARLIAATGITSRRWSEPGTRSADVGVDVLRRAFDDAGLRPDELRRVIFVSSTGGDFLTPSTATEIIGKLGIDGLADGFDMHNACVGYLLGMDLAARSVATGTGPTAVVCVEVSSRMIGPESPRAYTLFGDGAGAVVLGPSRSPGEGFRALAFANEWSDGPTIAVPHPGHARRLVLADFQAGGEKMAEMAVAGVVRAVERALAQARLGMDDIAHVLPHQPNGPLTRAILAALGVDPARVDLIVQEAGSLTSASIAVTLDRLRRSGRLAAGDRVLMCAVGSPLVYGAAIYEAGA